MISQEQLKIEVKLLLMPFSDAEWPFHGSSVAYRLFGKGVHYDYPHRALSLK